MLVTSQNGELIPLSKVAKIELISGPAWITSENGLMRVFVQSNVRDRDLGSFVEEAKQKISAEVEITPWDFHFLGRSIRKPHASKQNHGHGYSNGFIHYLYFVIHDLS